MDFLQQVLAMSPMGFIGCCQASHRWAELRDGLAIELILIPWHYCIPLRNGVILRHWANSTHAQVVAGSATL
jgi:hypothetical protein